MIKAFVELSALHQVFHAAQGHLEKKLGVPICIPTCGACCQVNVPGCMVIEGANIVSHLIGQGRLAAVAQVAEDWLLARHKEAGIYRGMPVGLVPQDIKREELALTQSRCPFLAAQDLKCMIHDTRPLVCRAYGVTRDPEGCPRPMGRGEGLTSRAVVDSTEVRRLVESFKVYCQKQPAWTIRGFAPAIVYRAAYPDKFRALVDDNRVASAKVIGTAMDCSLMWQQQVDAVRRGVPPDIVAYEQDAGRLLATIR